MIEWFFPVPFSIFFFIFKPEPYDFYYAEWQIKGEDASCHMLNEIYTWLLLTDTARLQVEASGHTLETVLSIQGW